MKTMKRLLLLGLLLIASVLLIACSKEGKPDDMREEDYEAAKEFVYMIDDVIDGNNDLSDGTFWLEFQADEIHDSHHNSTKSVISKAVDYTKGRCSQQDLIDKRNTFAESVGVKKRK